MSCEAEARQQLRAKQSEIILLEDQQLTQQQREVQLQQRVSDLEEQKALYEKEAAMNASNMEKALADKDAVLNQWRSQEDELEDLATHSELVTKQLKLCRVRSTVLESQQIGFDALTAKVELCFR